QVGVGGQLSVQQVGDRVFILLELQPIPGAVVAGHIPVANDVLAVHDGLDQALVARLVHLLEVGQNEVISIPVKEPPHRQPAVFRIRGGGIGRRVVAPQLETVGIDGRDHALAVQEVGLLLVQRHLGAVIQHSGGDFQVLIG
ncbi:Sigma-70, region 4, partial [Dysosmobacter welbionis]